MDIPINEKIKNRREKLGLSQTEVANKIGISQSSVADIESGATKNPRKPTLRALASVLQSTFGLDWLKSEMEMQGVSVDTAISRLVRGILYEEITEQGYLLEKIRSIIKEEVENVRDSLLEELNSAKSQKQVLVDILPEEVRIELENFVISSDKNDNLSPETQEVFKALATAILMVELSPAEQIKVRQLGKITDETIKTNERKVA